MRIVTQLIIMILFCSSWNNSISWHLFNKKIFDFLHFGFGIFPFLFLLKLYFLNDTFPRDIFVDLLFLGANDTIFHHFSHLQK
jgi:hypothetical protein